jgi:tetratricopeptide (TPR) repeat protein
VPTEPVEPGRWSVPGWLAVPTAALGSIALMGAGLFLALNWTGDNLAAGVAARAAMRAEDEKPIPLDPSERVETRWWKTTSLHLALWSSAIELSPDGSTRAGEVADAIDSARRAAPLQPSLRHASGDALGLSRDVVSLTLTGRTLKRAGKGVPALRAYRRAIEIAAEAAPTSLAPPSFDDDPRVRRFRLAHEEIVARVIRDMIAAGGWSYDEWSAALPPRAVVRLAAARTLREKGDTAGERALAAVLDDDVEVPASPGALAEHHAARAEALALIERKAEAAADYRRAIALDPDDLARRRHRLALAEILAATGEARERAEILEAARGTDPADPVSRKVLEAQQFAGLK